jgi:TldD protein
LLLSKDDLQEILAVAMQQGADFADIFLEQKITTGIGCEADQIERVNSGRDVGAGVRVISSDNTAYAYTNDLTLAGLKKVAAIVGEVAHRGQQRDVMLDLRSLSVPYRFEISEPPDAVSIEQKVNQVLRANKTAREADRRIRQVSVGYGDVVQQVVIANSENDYVEDQRVRTRFTVNVVAADGNVIQTGYEAAAGFKGFELFRDVTPEELAQKASARALLMLEARPAPTGKMPVVMAGEAGGTMVHEACGHGLEADLVQKGLSVYAGKKGKQVASPLISVIDDAMLPGKYGSLRFDDEGVPGQKTVLIKDGILQDYMYDRLTAMKERRASTGNGRRESYQDRPIPRMRNTYIAPGKDDPEEIIKSTKSGFLVKKMGGGQVNTTNGDFVFDVAEGYLIQDGEVTVPVRGATLTGNGPEVLQMIEMVGNDLGFAVGTCGKDGQGVPVADAQPTIFIRNLLVGGTSQANSRAKIRRI